MKKTIINIIYVLPLLLVIEAFCQDKDIKSRTGISFENKISKNLTLFSESELRLNNNLLTIDKALIEAGIDYKAYKFVKFSASYRFSKINKYDYYERQHRFTGDIAFYKKIKTIKIYWRNRYQSSFNYFHVNDFDNLPEQVLRSKLKMNYKINYTPASVYFFTEIYYNSSPFFTLSLYKYHFSLGITYNINKKTKINLYNIYEKEINTSPLETSFIFGLNICYKID
ncbi:MAG: hypothetical protein Kow0068_22930 [Marinilabiliales bacterium]